MAARRFGANDQGLLWMKFDEAKQKMLSEDPADIEFAMLFNPATIRTRPEKEVVAAVKKYCIEENNGDNLFVAAGLTNEGPLGRQFKKYGPVYLETNALYTEAEIAADRALHRLPARVVELQEDATRFQEETEVVRNLLTISESARTESEAKAKTLEAKVKSLEEKITNADLNCQLSVAKTTIAGQKELKAQQEKATEKILEVQQTNTSMAMESIGTVNKITMEGVTTLTENLAGKFLDHNISSVSAISDLANNKSFASTLNTSAIGHDPNESKQFIHLSDKGNLNLFDEKEEEKNTLATKILPTDVATAPARGTGLIASDPKMPAATTLYRTDQPVTAGSLIANPTTTNTGEPVTTENPAANPVAPARGTGLIASDPKMPAATTLYRTDQPVTAGSLIANPTTTNTGEPVTTGNPAASPATIPVFTESTIFTLSMCLISIEKDEKLRLSIARILYEENHAIVEKENPGASSFEVAKIISSKYKELNAHERKVWNKERAVDEIPGKEPVVLDSDTSAPPLQADLTLALRRRLEAVKAKRATGDDTPVAVENGKIGAKETAAAAAAKKSDATAAEKSPTTTANQAAAAAAAKKSDATAAVKSPTTKANQAAAAKKSDATAAVTSPTTEANQAAAAAAAKKSDDPVPVERNGVSISWQEAAAAAKKSDATAAVKSPTTKANQAAAAAAAKKSDNDQVAVERNGVSNAKRVFLFFLLCLIFKDFIRDTIKDLGQKVHVVQINSGGWWGELTEMMFGLITKLKDFPQHADDVVNKVRNWIQALFSE